MGEIVLHFFLQAIQPSFNNGFNALSYLLCYAYLGWSIYYIISQIRNLRAMTN